jgi:hypothetical protein
MVWVHGDTAMPPIVPLARLALAQELYAHLTSLALHHQSYVSTPAKLVNFVHFSKR